MIDLSDKRVLYKKMKLTYFTISAQFGLILKEIQNQTTKETTNVLNQTLAFFCGFCATYI